MKVASKKQFQLIPGEWVHENIIRTIFGFTTDQLQKYRASGLFLEGTHYRKNPARRIVYNVSALNSWMGGAI